METVSICTCIRRLLIHVDTWLRIKICNVPYVDDVTGCLSSLSGKCHKCTKTDGSMVSTRKFIELDMHIANESDFFCAPTRTVCLDH